MTNEDYRKRTILTGVTLVTLDGTMSALFASQRMWGWAALFGGAVVVVVVATILNLRSTP